MAPLVFAKITSHPHMVHITSHHITSHHITSHPHMVLQPGDTSGVFSMSLSSNSFRAAESRTGEHNISSSTLLHGGRTLHCSLILTTCTSSPHSTSPALVALSSLYSYPVVPACYAEGRKQCSMGQHAFRLAPHDP